MKKATKLILMLSVVIAVLIGATAIVSAAESQTVQIGSSNVTITSDKGFMVPRSSNPTAGVKVTFQITSDNSPIESVRVCNETEDYNSNSVTYTYEYDDLRQDVNVMKITLKDGSYEELYNCPLILPASYPSGDISVKTDPTGLAISAYGWKSINGSEYLIAVYKDSARTKFLGSYYAETEAGAVSILKKNNSWYKANTKYYLSIYPVNYYEINGEQKMLMGKPTKKTIQTSPTTKPVIKSVKVSNVKVKKYFDYSSWKYRYTTTYKLTITLSKKASNIKGLMVQASGGEYTAKGTGKVFTVNVRSDSGMSYAGKKVKVRVMTYSASASYGYALSSPTKYRTYTVKNGTY
ncbi:MAG: hypothetical protein ACI4LA_03290 [Emergencia sp.]